MDDYYIIRQLLIEALYERAYQTTAQAERDACASAIRKIKREDVEERKLKLLREQNAGADQKS